MREWHKTADNSAIKCPICEEYFEDIVVQSILSCTSPSRGNSGMSLSAEPAIVHGKSSGPDQNDADVHAVHVETQGFDATARSTKDCRLANPTDSVLPSSGRGIVFTLGKYIDMIGCKRD